MGSFRADNVVRPGSAMNNWTRGFWEGCQEGQFRIQSCKACGKLRFPPSPCCPQCLSPETEWIVSTGRGEIESFVIFHQVYLKGLTDAAPYNVAVVKLNEGVRTITNVEGIDHADLRIGLQVEVEFQRGSEGVSVPVFRPVR